MVNSPSPESQAKNTKANGTSKVYKFMVFELKTHVNAFWLEINNAEWRSSS